jgi:hypothetical protein
MNWHVTKHDHEKLDGIARRASALAKQNGVEYSERDALMDLTAVHANGCPLRLDELAAADEGNFGHDVFGIRRHIDRSTGKLRDFFSPRFSR